MVESRVLAGAMDMGTGRRHLIITLILTIILFFLAYNTNENIPRMNHLITLPYSSHKVQ